MKQRIAIAWEFWLCAVMAMALALLASDRLAVETASGTRAHLAPVHAELDSLATSLPRARMSTLNWALAGSPEDRRRAYEEIARSQQAADALNRDAARAGGEVARSGTGLHTRVDAWVEEFALPLLQGPPITGTVTTATLAPLRRDLPSYEGTRNEMYHLERAIGHQQGRSEADAGRIRSLGLLATLLMAALTFVLGAEGVRTGMALAEARERAERERIRLATVFDRIPIGLAIVSGHSLDDATITINPSHAAVHQQRNRDPVPLAALRSQTPCFRPDRKTRVPLEELPGTRALLTGEAVRQEEMHVHRPDGTWRVVLDTAAPLRDARGALFGSVVAIQDITERYELEQESDRQRALLDTVLEQIPEAIFILDEAGRLQRTNPAGARLVGTGSAAAHLPIGDIVARIQPRDPDGRPVLPDETAPARALAGETVRGQPILSRSPDTGEPTHALLSAAPLRNADGRLFGVAMIAADVTESKRIEEELREANAAKDRFLAILSHELRNPLAPLLASVPILKRSADDPEKVRHVAEIVDRNVKMQARLVNDLLDLSRISRGKMELRRQRVDLSELAAELLEAVANDVQAAGLAVRKRLTPGLWVDGDADRLQQMVMNLLSNSIKFTPAGGTIRVSAEPAEGQVRLVVEDTGIGIDPALRGHLFEMFRQGESSTQRKQGLGIGLALVKMLAEMHGGSVHAESEGPGRGSRFTVELPRAEAPAAPSPATKPLAEGDRPHVLVVEDNADAREALSLALELMDYDVESAADPEAALSRVASAAPEAILCDIGLPGMDGYELLRRIRARPGMERVPAFALTGLASADDVRRAHQAGFDDHLTKPVDLDELDHRLREALGRATNS